jgi:hypothetical protein
MSHTYKDRERGMFFLMLPETPEISRFSMAAAIISEKA